ncbi:hypothetical protein DFJ74DRAFT_771620 [Hyaloraphidium curvatum]|nr:hypothetical protein DFJ74DRAFT_771620 [Hyaloraphidium curvatum]
MPRHSSALRHIAFALGLLLVLVASRPSIAQVLSGAPPGIASRRLPGPTIPLVTHACVFPRRPSLAFITAQEGGIFLHDAAAGTVRSFARVTTTFVAETGLLACAVDDSTPQMALILFVTVGAEHRVVRYPFTLSPPALRTAGARVLLRMPYVYPRHAGSWLGWQALNATANETRSALLVSRGEDSQCDGDQPRCAFALQADDFRGKIMRIDPVTGAGLPGNMWFRPSSPLSNRARVHSWGFRNPWAVASHPTNPRLLAVFDPGWETRETLRIVGPGEHGGWPCFEGSLPHLAGRCNATVRAGIRRRWAEYPHVDGDNCMIGGAFFPSSFRASLRNRALFGDLASGRLRTVPVAADGRPGAMGIFARLYGVVRIVQGPRGRLWLIMYGQGAIVEVWDTTPAAA